MTETSKAFEQALYAKEEIEDQLDILAVDEAIPADIVELEAMGIGAKKCALVVGHTKSRPGAYGIKPILEYEYPWNKALAEAIKNECIDLGINCGIFYRDGRGIVAAYRQVKDWNPDRCIELHFNASTPPARGTETLYGVVEVSKAWAQEVQDGMGHLYSRTGRQNRGIKFRTKGERGYTSLTQLQDIPSCLVEPFFGNSDEDSQLGHSLVSEYAKILVDAFNKSVPD